MGLTTKLVQTKKIATNYKLETLAENLDIVEESSEGLTAKVSATSLTLLITAASFTALLYIKANIIQD